MGRGPITYRRARTHDAQESYRVVRAAVEDLLARAGHPASDGSALPLERVLAFRRSCLEHDPDGFWVAELDGRLVGAAIAVVRGDVWYLGALHVLPDRQGAGVGTELLRRVLTGAGPARTRVVLTDALNPVSNGLYLRHGMLPAQSILGFDGPLPATARSRAAGAPTASRPWRVRPLDPDADADALARLDRASVGFERVVDHRFWTSVPGLAGHVLVTATGVRGYLYVSDVGAIGPAVVEDPDDLPAALDLAAAVARDLGAERVHLRVMGSTQHALEWALRCGLRLSGIGLMLASRPVGRFEGYVTSGADALY